MSWKPSKRQSQLKKRLIDSSRVYLETSHTLDQMLLKMLHNNNVYTPDDFYNKYIKSTHILDSSDRKKDANTDINQVLINLNKVLCQLRQIINNKN